MGALMMPKTGCLLYRFVGEGSGVFIKPSLGRANERSKAGPESSGLGPTEV